MGGGSLSDAPLEHICEKWIEVKRNGYFAGRFLTNRRPDNRLESPKDADKIVRYPKEGECSYLSEKI